MRSVHKNLLNHFEAKINSHCGAELEFAHYKSKLRSRYEGGLKRYLLLPYQRTFVDRIFSPLEDRKAWLSSVAQAVIGKPLEQSNDEDELKLFDRLPELIHELDNLNEIGKQNIAQTDDTFKLEITLPGEKPRKQVITMPKEKTAEFNNLQLKINSALEHENRFMKIAILAEMLKQELGNDGK